MSLALPLWRRIELGTGWSSIEASAGTGKTYTLVRLAMRLIVERDISLRECAILTFTQAAAAELEDRLFLLLKEVLHIARVFKSKEETKSIDNDIDPHLRAWCQDLLDKGHDVEEALRRALAERHFVSIGTIHSFCGRINASLSPAASRMRPGAEYVATKSWELAWLRNEVQEVKRHFSPETTPWLNTLLNASRLAPLLPLWRKSSPPRHFYAKVYQSNTANRVKEIHELAQEHDACVASFKQQTTYLAEHFKGELDAFHFAYQEGFFNKNKVREKRVHEFLTMLGKTRDASWNAAPEDMKLLSENLAKLNRVALENARKKNIKVPPLAMMTQVTSALERLVLQVCSEIEEIQLAILDGMALHFRSARQHFRDTQQCYDFDDLLRDTLERVRLTGASQHFKALIVDEFQDTDRVQAEIFEALFPLESHCVFLIGDPKQSIYGFRGAELDTYFTASERSERHYTLDTNYRSQPGINAALNSWLCNSDAFAPTTLSYTPVQTSQEDLKEDNWHIISNENLETPVVDALMRARQESPNRPWHDYAILVRSNTEISDYTTQLEHAGIPCHTSARWNPELTKLFRETIALYMLPTFDAFRSLLLHPLFETKGLTSKQFPPMATMESFEYWCQNARDLSPGKALLELIALSGGAQKRGKVTSLSTPLTMLVHALNQLTDQFNHSTMKLGQPLPFAATVMMTNARDLESWFEDIEATMVFRAKPHFVSLLTWHKSKGLEFDTVLHPSLASYNPNASLRAPASFMQEDKHRIVLPSTFFRHYTQKEPAPKLIETLNNAQLGETKRMLYVALTRAARSNWIFVPELHHGNIRNDFATPKTASAKSASAKSSAARLKKTLAPSSIFSHMTGISNLSSREEWVNSIHRRVSTTIEEAQETQPSTLVFKGAEDLVIPCVENTNLSQTKSKTGLTTQKRECRDGLKEDMASLSSLEIREEDAYLLHSPHRAHSFSSLHASAHATPTELDAESKEQRDTNSKRVLPRQANLGSSEGSTKKTSVLSPHLIGADFGNWVHEVLEKLELFHCDHEDIAKVVRATRPANFSKVDECEIALHISKILEAQLPGASNTNFSLADLKMETCLREPAFTFQLSESHLLNVLRKGQGVRRHDTLFGFIDMVFEHNGEFYIVDYKTNHLGDDLKDYQHDALARVMREQDYTLQAKIYSHSLRTWFKAFEGAASKQGRWKLPRSIHVLYLFTRGLTLEARQPKDGVFKIEVPCE